MRVLMITTVWPTAEQPGLAPFVTRQVEFLRKEGVDVTVFHLCGNKNPLSYLRARREVKRLLHNGHFDLVHAQWGQSGLAALARKVPLVVTFRGSDVAGIAGSPLAGKVLTAASRLVAARADQAIVVSRHMTHMLPARNYHVIPSGLNLELFRPVEMNDARRALGLNPDRKYVLFAASPTNPVKRYGLASAAVKRMGGGNDVELLVIHDCSHDLIPLYMNACNALLVTSRHEGSPNVVKEALACNLPVVSVDVGDVAERLKGVEGCVVCHDDSVDNVALALRDVLQRNSRLKGRRTVAHLDETLLARQVISVYHRALAATPTGRLPAANGKN